MRTLITVSMFLGTLGVSSSPLFANPKVEETVVGPAGAGSLFVVSQNDARVAYVGTKGTRTVVSIDGVEGPVLDELFNGSAATISAAGQVLVHSANAGGKFNGTPSAEIFSETGSHYAYIGRQGNDYVVVHDGKEVGRGPRNSLSPQHSPLGLLPKGNFAFWGEMKTEGGRIAVIMRKRVVNYEGVGTLYLDGKEVPGTEGAMDITFSPDAPRNRNDATRALGDSP